MLKIPNMINPGPGSLYSGPPRRDGFEFEFKAVSQENTDAVFNEAKRSAVSVEGGSEPLASFIGRL